MVLFAIMFPVAALLYLLLVGADDKENQAQEDMEQMEFLRRYTERKKK